MEEVARVIKRYDDPDILQGHEFIRLSKEPL
jgi:hypothetical protein